MTTIRTALTIAGAAAFILLMSNQALADEEDSRKACESLAALSSQVFRVDTSQWVATSRQPAGPGGVTDGGSRPLPVSRRYRSASIRNRGRELWYRH